MTRLPANKWVTVAWSFGPMQRMLHVTVDADVECKWRERCGPFMTSYGSFRHEDTFRLFNQSVQIKSPVETAYHSHFDVLPAARQLR